jgi:hypothetical protein
MNEALCTCELLELKPAWHLRLVNLSREKVPKFSGKVQLRQGVRDFGNSRKQQKAVVTHGPCARMVLRLYSTARKRIQS